MKYCYSNISKSKGVSNKVARQVDILQITGENIIELNKVNFLYLFFRYLISKQNERWYFREGLLVNIFILVSLKKDFSLELNRPLSSLIGRRSKITLWIRRFMLLRVLSRSRKIISVSKEIHNSLPEAAQFKSCTFPNFFGFNHITAARGDTPGRKQIYDLVIVADLEQPWQAKDFLEEFLLCYPDRTLLHVGKGFIDAPNFKSLGFIEDMDTLRAEIQSAKVALSQLGLKRIGMTEATPLKHVDYVACGLPIISGAVDTLLDGAYPIYYLQTEDVKNLEEIIVNIENTSQELSSENLEERVSLYEEEFFLVCNS